MHRRAGHHCCCHCYCLGYPRCQPCPCRLAPALYLRYGVRLRGQEGKGAVGNLPLVPHCCGTLVLLLSLRILNHPSLRSFRAHSCKVSSCFPARLNKQNHSMPSSLVSSALPAPCSQLLLRCCAPASPSALVGLHKDLRYEKKRICQSESLLGANRNEIPDHTMGWVTPSTQNQIYSPFFCLLLRKFHSVKPFNGNFCELGRAVR